MGLFPRFCLALLLGAVCTVSLSAQPQKLLQTGPQPLAVIADGARLHIICNRIDLNFDGVQDEGDSPARWYVVDNLLPLQDREAELMLEFNWDDGMGFPLRAAVDEENGLLLLPLAEEVRAYSTLDGSVNLDVNLPWVATAVSIDPRSGEAVLSERNSPGSDVVRIVDLASGESETFETGENVQQNLVWYNSADQRRIVVLNEGVFGESGSSLSIIKPGADPERRDIPLGNTGNHLLLDGDRVFATVNGDHVVHEISLENERIVNTFNVGTSGFNGPRESVLFDGSLYVTTYESDIRRIDLAGGDVSAVLTSGGRPEGIAFWEGRLWIANAYETGNFTSANSVAVLHPKLSTDIVAVLPAALQPAHLHATPDGVVALSNQVDLNFNGIREEDDQPQSVAMYSTLDGDVEWRSELPWGAGNFPLRPGFDVAEEYGYFINGAQIRRIGLDGEVNDPLADINLVAASAVSVSPDGTMLVVSERGAESGRLRLIELADPQNERVIETAPWIQQTIWYDNKDAGFDLLVLDEGEFGGGRARLLFADTESAQMLSQLDLDLGEGGNHMFLSEGLLYITLTGTHEVAVVDPASQTVLRRIATQTLGFNGPREAVLFNNELYVTTFSSDVRRFNSTTGELLQRYETGGKPEGIAVYNDRIWVANAFEFNDFGSAANIAVIGPDNTTTSVGDSEIVHSTVQEQLLLSPNPAAFHTVVSLDAGSTGSTQAELEIRTLDGKLVFQQAADLGISGTTDIDLASFNNGAYMITMRRGDQIFTAPLLVNK